MPLTPGTCLGPYQILVPLGAGGMGEVYVARDSKLDREVAVKVLPPRLADDAGAQARFEREAKAVAALSHPNILAIHDFGREGGISYAVMELLEGETLRQRLRREPPTRRTAIRFAIQIAQGLSAAHDKGVVHRDLKPENLFVTDDGNLKILDFGLSKLTRVTPEDESVSEEATVSRQTSPGTVMGTTGYMSPEQVRGADADHRTDIFSFGVVLYEMLAGNRPFQGESLADVMSAILKEDPPEHPNVPPMLMRIVSRCLEKKPSERFRSARDLALALEAIGETGSGVSQPVAPQDEAPPSIAVLPFTNMSSDEEQEYFCEGMAEEIINALAKMEGLRVVSRTSSFQFKGKAEDIRRIGETLNVATVLEGSVRSAGKRLRITAQLINVSDGFHLWSERYDREMEDVFAVQDEISENIVDALRVKLVGRPTAERSQRHPTNLEAYHLYLKGQYCWNQYYKQSMEQALHFFELAAEKDPSYALAHAGVAIAHSFLGLYGARRPEEGRPAARAAVERALAIDDRLAEARAAEALVRRYFDFDWAGARRAFEQAIALNPSYALAYSWYGDLQMCAGKPDEGLELAEPGQALDPLSPYANSVIAWAYLTKEQSQKAIRRIEKVLELNSNYVLALVLLSVVYAHLSRHEEAVRVMEQAAAVGGRTSLQLGWLGFTYAAAGRDSDALRILDELKDRAEQHYVSPIFFAWIYIGCGEKDRAMECLETSCRARDPLVIQLNVLPLYNRLRSDGRFRDLLRRLRLPV